MLTLLLLQIAGHLVKMHWSVSLLGVVFFSQNTPKCVQRSKLFNNLLFIKQGESNCSLKTELTYIFSISASTVSTTIVPARQLSGWRWGDSTHQSSGKDLDDRIWGLSPCPSARKELWSWWHGLLRTFCQKWGLKTRIHLSLRRQLRLWPGWRYQGCCDKDSTRQIQAQTEGGWWEVAVRVLQGHVQSWGEQTGSMPGCSRPRQDLHPSSELYVVRRHYALSLYVWSGRRLYRSLLVWHQWWNVLPPVDGPYRLVFHCSMYVLLLAASGLSPLWGHVQVLWWKTQSCWMTTDEFRVLCFSCSSRNTLVFEH